MRQENNNIPILMTASVSTNGMKGACFTDEEREQMYLQTLGYYMNMFEGLRQRIVFVDNSGWDMERFKSKIQPTQYVEFISLNKSDFDISKGKGYNELLMINQAIEKSSFIHQTGNFFKVTGRYPIYNLPYFLRSATNFINGGGKFFGDMKDHKLYDLLGTDWNGHSGEARLFGCTTEWYMNNIGCRYSELNDYKGFLVEDLLFDVLKNTTDKVSKRFKREPHFGGIEGSNENAMTFSKNQNSLVGNIKRYFGNFIRLFFPFFWF